MRLALIQEKQNRLYDFSAGELPGGGRFSFDEAQSLQTRVIEQNFSLMEEAADKGADFLLTSEAVNFPGPRERLAFPQIDLVSRGYDRLRENLCRMAKKRRVWLAAGVYRPLPGGGMRNSVLVINSRGDTAAVYDKIHLAGSEKNGLTAGDTFCCFDSEFGRMGICICWDMQFPETCRILTLRGARIILCPTWGWEGIYAGSRAYENGVYAAGAMAVPFGAPIAGIRSPSSVIDPEGNILALAGAENAEVLYCDVDLCRDWDIRRTRMEDRRPELYGALGGQRSATD